MNAKQMTVSLLAVVGAVWLALKAFGDVDQKYVPLLCAGISGAVVGVGYLINFRFNPLRTELYKRQVEAVLKLKDAVDRHASTFGNCLANHTSETAFSKTHYAALEVYNQNALVLPHPVQQSFLAVMQSFLDALSHGTDVGTHESYRNFVNACRRVVGTVPVTADTLR